MDTAMYITCVLSVDSDQAFGIKFTKDTSIAQLKQDIHKERPDWLSDLVPAVLKLYLIHSVDDDQYIEGTSKLPDQNCIPLSRPTKTLGDYVGDRDLNTVYVFVAFQPPQPAAQRAETEELKALRTTIETLNNRLDFYEKNRHKFSIVVEPKHKAITWDVDISTVTLDDLSRKLSNHYPTEYDHVGMFVIKSDKEQYPLTTDEILQSTLRWLINVGKTEFKVGKANPAKPFSDYDLGAIVQLYGLSDNEHPDQSVFPEYTCGREPLKNPALIPLLQHVLGIFDSVTPLKHSREATHSLYVHVFLALTAVDFKTELGTPFSVIPEKYIEGLYGRGPVDYAIDLTGGLTVGITEVKKEDFDKGIAQNAVQIASALEKKRKRGANDIDGSNNVPESCFGIVTNAKEWKFLRCTRVGDDIKFELSKSYTVSFGNETGDENIKEVAERIKWLLMEAQSTNTPASDGTKRVKLIHPASEVEYLG